MKKPEITPGEWEYAGGDNLSVECILPNTCTISLDRRGRYETDLKMSRDEMRANMKAISAVPYLIEEGIKALDDLYDFYYQGAISDGQSHDAAEDFAQNKTKGLYEALKKAGAQL